MWPKYNLYIHRPCKYMPLPPIKENHANPSLAIGELAEWWKRGKLHTGSLTLAFRPACSVVRGDNPLRQAPFSRINQFELILKGVTSGELKLVGGRGWTRTVGRWSRSVRVCIDRLLATRGSSWRLGARSKQTL